MSPAPADATVRLMAKVRVLDSGCWEWTAGTSNHGTTPVFNMGRKSMLGARSVAAAKAAWLLFVGPIADERLTVCRTCGTTLCVRPEHHRLLLGRATDPLDRFMQFVAIRENGCWEWTGLLSNQGYGRFKAFGEKLAHRVSHRLFIGEFTPERPDCAHKCDNPKCVAPSHLFAASHLENMRDMAAKGRHRWGPNAPHRARLSAPAEATR